MKWIKGLIVRLKTQKIPRRKSEKKFFDVGFGNNFLDMIPKTQRANAKHNQQNEMATYEMRNYFQIIYLMRG